MKKPSQKRAKELATVLHSRIIRARTPHCQAASTGVLTTPCTSGGATTPLQCAHIISRKYAVTRTTLFNGWTVCAGHHKVIDTNPDIWLELVLETCGLPVVRGLRAAVRDASENGMGVSSLMFWRSELDRLYTIALAEGVKVTDLPHWLATNHQEKAVTTS